MRDRHLTTIGGCSADTVSVPVCQQEKDQPAAIISVFFPETVVSSDMIHPVVLHLVFRSYNGSKWGQTISLQAEKKLTRWGGFVSSFDKRLIHP